MIYPAPNHKSAARETAGSLDLLIVVQDTDKHS